MGTTERKTTPKAATERETAQKAATALETAPTAATARVSSPKASTEQEIEPMDWGTTSSRQYFYEQWGKEIETMDGGAFERSGSNIYKYLIAKLMTVLNNTKKIGSSGWAFYLEREYVCGTVWADGTHGQELPLQSIQANEQWWPCVFLRKPLPDGLLPFYCPALAWANA